MTNAKGERHMSIEKRIKANEKDKGHQKKQGTNLRLEIPISIITVHCIYYEASIPEGNHQSRRRVKKLKTAVWTKQ